MPASFGTIYCTDGNPRTVALRILAKQNKLDINYVEEAPAKGVSAEFRKKFPMGKIPAFEGNDGYLLHECNAIAIYCKFLFFFTSFGDEIHFKTVYP